MATDAGSTGVLTIEGGTVHTMRNVTIGSATSDGATLIQTGGVLLVDGQLITRFVEDGGGTASGYDFSGGILTRSTPDILFITGDLVMTDTAAVTVNGGTLQETSDPSDPFSGFPGLNLDGITLYVSEGFRSVDGDATPGNFTGGGRFDLTGFALPTTNGLALQSGILWFAFIGDATGSSGGDDLEALNSTFLDDIDLWNLGNAGDAIRLSEFDFENNMGLGKTFDPTFASYYALVNGDGILGFPNPRTGPNLGVAWAITVPEPGRVMLLFLSLAATLLRRRRRHVLARKMQPSE